MDEDWRRASGGVHRTSATLVELHPSHPLGLVFCFGHIGMGGKEFLSKIPRPQILFALL